MLKIDNKYVNKYIGSEIPSISVITPCKTCRTYVFSNNRMLCVETKGSEGAFEKGLSKISDQYNVKYEKYENSKHNVYVGTINYFFMKNKKHKCALCCNKVATWKMRSSPNKIRVKYFCDDCLPKKMISGYSFEYSVNGFDLKKENKDYYVNYYDCIECLDDNTKDMTLDEEFLLTDKFGEIFVKLKSKINPEYVKYNDIMSKFGDYLVSYCSKMFSIQTIEKHRKFYLNFKKDVSKKKVLINGM